MTPAVKFWILVAALGLAGCVSVPTGPSMVALPGTGKSFEQFRYDEGGCKQYAYEQVGGQTATRAQNDSAAQSAIAGTAIGALAGAAIDGSSGAAVGAGLGLLTGALIGSSTGNASAYEAQRRYDGAYIQCMYGKGHRVPVSRRYAAPTSAAAPAPTYSIPPPPPGSPPPPPPGTAR